MDASCRVCGVMTALPDLEVRGHLVDFVCVGCGAPPDATQTGAGVPARANRARVDRAMGPDRQAPDGERGAAPPPEASEAAAKGNDERLLDLRTLASLPRAPGAEAQGAADLVDAPASVRTAIRQLSQVLIPVGRRAVRGGGRGGRIGLVVGAAIVGAAVVAIVERGLHDTAAVASASDPVAADRGDGLAAGAGRAVPEAWTGEASPGASPGERGALAGRTPESTPQASAGRAQGAEPRRAAGEPERARTRDAVAGAAGARGDQETAKGASAPEARRNDGATSEAATPAPAQDTSAPTEPSSSGAPASGRSLDQAIADAVGAPGTSPAGSAPAAAAPSAMPAAAAPSATPAGATPAASSAEPPPGAPAASGSSGAQLDRAAAAAALQPIASSLSSCKASPEDSGRGSVAVTFVPSGAVSVAVVNGPFAGTPTGACIARLFRAARVPPFTGSPVVVRRSFNVP